MPAEIGHQRGRGEPFAARMEEKRSRVRPLLLLVMVRPKDLPQRGVSPKLISLEKSCPWDLKRNEKKVLHFLPPCLHSGHLTVNFISFGESRSFAQPRLWEFSQQLSIILLFFLQFPRRSPLKTEYSFSGGTWLLSPSFSRSTFPHFFPQTLRWLRPPVIAKSSYED